MPNTHAKLIDVAILLSIVTGKLMKVGIANDATEIVAWIINGNAIRIEDWQRAAGWHLVSNYKVLEDFWLENTVTPQNYQTLLAEFKSQYGDKLLIAPMPKTEQQTS